MLQGADFFFFSLIFFIIMVAMLYSRKYGETETKKAPQCHASKPPTVIILACPLP